MAAACALYLASGHPLAQAPANPHANDDLGVVAADRWIGRALILRGFPIEDDLRFDPAGNPKDKFKATDWTLAGFDLDNVARRGDGDLQLDGFRVAIRYNPDQHVFERHRLKEESVRIRLEAPSAPGVERALAAMFSVGIDPALQRSMPPYWSHFFISGEGWPADALTGLQILGLNDRPPPDALYPEVEKKAEPGFTPEATRDRVRGLVQLRMVVDGQGIPQRIAIRQPLGYGLDAKTVDAAQRYRFRPGVVHGAPTAVEVTMNQTFQ